MKKLTKEEILKLGKSGYLGSDVNYFGNTDCFDCARCFRCFECYDCLDCFACRGQQDKQYAVHNVQLTEAEYKSFMTK